MYFISYSSEDTAWADWMADILREEGIDEVRYMAKFENQQDFMADINRALDECDRTIGILTHSALKSQWVRSEWNVALRLKRLVFVRLQDCEAPGLHKNAQYIDLTRQVRAKNESAARQVLVAGLWPERDPRPRTKAFETRRLAAFKKASLTPTAEVLPRGPGDADDPVLRMGHITPRYTVTAALGEGAMGTAYAAIDSHLEGSRVVVKTPKFEHVEVPGLVSAFLTEVKALIQLKHPRIVKITDAGSIQGLSKPVPFSVMEYMEGKTLRERLSKSAHPQSVSEVLEWARPVAEALDYAHGRGFVHRDVKPDNIFFDHGLAYLGDFGLARSQEALQSSLSVHLKDIARELPDPVPLGPGAPAYMAPEQMRGERHLTGSADQYGLASTVYEALSGGQPFQGVDLRALLQLKQKRSPPSLARHPDFRIPQAVSDVVAQGLSTNPSARFPTCTDFVDALEGSEAAQDYRPVGAALLAFVAILLLVFVKNAEVIGIALFLIAAAAATVLYLGGPLSRRRE